jgi:isoleucyl-tRNA synthetase
MIHTKPTYAITIMTKHKFRKAIIETFVGVWDSEEQIKRVLSRFRPKAELLEVYPLAPTLQKWLVSKRQEFANKSEKDLDEYSFDSIFNELIREVAKFNDSHRYVEREGDINGEIAGYRSQSVKSHRQLQNGVGEN